jgi:hypothetical protein
VEPSGKEVFDKFKTSLVVKGLLGAFLLDRSEETAVANVSI